MALANLTAGATMLAMNLFQQFWAWEEENGDVHLRDSNDSVAINPFTGRPIMDLDKAAKRADSIDWLSAAFDFTLGFVGQAFTARLFHGAKPLFANLKDSGAWLATFKREVAFSGYNYLTGTLRSFFWESDLQATALANVGAGVSVGTTQQFMHWFMSTEHGRVLFPRGFNSPIYAALVRPGVTVVAQGVSRLLADVKPALEGSDSPEAPLSP